MFILLYFSTPHACTLHHVCYTISNVRPVICLAMPFLNRIPLASIQHRSTGLTDLKESTWSNVRSAYLARTLRSTLEEAVWICFASGTVYLSTQTQRVQLDHFTDTAAIMNLSNLWSIMGCPGGHSLSIFALFRQKENFIVYFSRKRRSLLHLNTPQRSFFPLQYFSRKT